MAVVNGRGLTDPIAFSKDVCYTYIGSPGRGQPLEYSASGLEYSASLNSNLPALRVGRVGPQWRAKDSSPLSEDVPDGWRPILQKGLALPSWRGSRD